MLSEAIRTGKILEKDFAFRLGLSATPERYRDDEGTAMHCLDFFGGVVEPEVTLGRRLKKWDDWFPTIIIQQLQRN